MHAGSSGNETDEGLGSWMPVGEGAMTDRSTLAVQKALVAHLKRRLKQHIPQTPELDRYYEEFRRELTDFGVPSWPGELLAALGAAQVAYVGDFHTHVQSQKLVDRLLTMLHDEHRASIARDPSRPPPHRVNVLAMEAFLSRHQPHLDRFMAGECTSDELLELVRWDRTWGFPAAGYLRILETCRDLGIRVVGINSTARGERTLHRRDRHAARIIARLHKENPHGLVMVFIGDLHVAVEHLPARVLEQLARRNRTIQDCIVYVNPESVFWALAESGLDYIVNIVKITHRQFCVINSTPVARYDSYLRFVEGVIEEDDPDDFAPASADVADYIRELAGRIGRFLQLSRLSLPDVDIVVWQNPDETAQQLATRLDAPADSPARVRAASLARHPLAITDSSLLIHSFTLNDAADAAARLVLQAGGWRQRFLPAGRSFFGDALFEALAYFASKVINPKRACKKEDDLRQWAKQSHSSRRVRKAVNVGAIERFVLPHLSLLATLGGDSTNVPLPTLPAPRGLTLPARMEVTRVIGHRLGEKLFYYAHVGLPSRVATRRSRDRYLDRATLSRTFRQPPPTEADARRLYLELWKSAAQVQEHHDTRAKWL